MTGPDYMFQGVVAVKVQVLICMGIFPVNSGSYGPSFCVCGERLESVRTLHLPLPPLQAVWYS